MALWLLSAGATAQDPGTVASPSDPILRYDIQARLDPGSKTVEGEQILSWRNPSQEPIQDFHFHLYLNAFKNNRSSMMWERDLAPFWKGRDPIPEDYWGSIEIRSIRILEADPEGPSQVVSRSYIQPDDDNPEDQTVLRLLLDRPLPPGQSIRFWIDFTSKLPRGIRRTGWVEDYFFVAQWFPKIGVFQDGVWNCHQYHRTTEFFADFGVYDVSLTVPSGYVVGATGRRMSETNNGDGTRTYRHVQENVHDFAWTASSRFLERIRKFESPGLPPVEMRLLLVQEHEHLESRYFQAAEHALRLFGNWFGPYPYRVLTIVDPPHNSETGGMEYPTLVTGKARFWSPAKTLSPEEVTIHEIGHQWWYGMVASNEFEESWLDEGITSWATSRAEREAYRPPVHVEWVLGKIPMLFPSLSLPFETGSLPAARKGGALDVLVRSGWKYQDRFSYVVNSYYKPEQILWTLERYVGEEVMLRIMRTYFQRYRYRHPTTKDFVKTVNEVSARNLDWFFQETIQSASLVDYAVTEATSKTIPEREGLTEEASGAEESKGSSPELYRSKVLVSRLGGARFPVDVRMEFEDGSRVVKRWDGQYRWIRFEFRKTARLRSAVVDPDRQLLLDIDPTNNSRVVQSSGAGQYSLATRKWASKWLFWMQNLLEILALIS